ncbi:sulfatase [bacterium]|nr:sulfatase [candidate division CSSED10-310 bacterium]
MTLIKKSMLIMAALVGLAAAANAQRKQPNVVLIVIDTLRADHLPFLGYKVDTAPFLTSLAADSAVFTHAYAASSWTAPATASILTSLYPFQHGVTMGMLATKELQKINPDIKINRIPDEIETLPETLKAAGYTTYAITDNINICEAEGFHKGFDRFINHRYQGAETVAAELKEWLPEIRAQERSFIYLHFNDPHQPLHERAPWYVRRDSVREDMLAKYDSEIRYLDAHLKDLFTLFGWRENTLVVVTADHGEEFWDHGGMGHGYSLYNEVIHVPLFFYLPGATRRGVVINHTVSTLDVAPTVRAILGLPPGERDAGVNLLPVIATPKMVVDERTVFSHLLKTLPDGLESGARAAVCQEWKVYNTYVGENQSTTYLFNLTADPGEQENLYETTLSFAQELISRYHWFVKNCAKAGQEMVDYSLNEDEIEQLKSLGYIQ